LRPPAHDSGPVWIATPSPYDSFIHYIPSILSAHRRKPESSIFAALRTSWTPVFTGVTTH